MRRVVLPILCLCLILCGCGATAEPTENTLTFDIDVYKQSVSTCIKFINESAILLHNAVSMECKYLDILGKADADGAFETAMKFLEENSDYNEESLRTQYEDISEMYKEIIAENIDGTEAQEIKESYKKLFDAYVGLYNLAMSPTGTPSTISSSHDDYIGVIQTELSKLETLLQ